MNSDHLKDPLQNLDVENDTSKRCIERDSFQSKSYQEYEFPAVWRCFFKYKDKTLFQEPS